MGRRQLLLNNYEASRIDFVGSFVRLWVSFNTWYNDHSSHRSEQQRVTSAGVAGKLSTPYWIDLRALNEPAYNDNFEHIVTQVENSSTHKYLDANGNEVRSYSDTTGFRYRLRCNRRNVHTDFLHHSTKDSILKGWCEGIAQFNIETRQDPLFKGVYLGYKRDRFNKMHLRFNALDHIPAELLKMGINQFGCTLFHQLSTPTHQKSDIAKLSDVYGRGFISKMTKANDLGSCSQARKKFPKAGRNGAYYKWLEARNLDLLQRELLLLYKFRSSIVHGDRDPKSETVQKLARAAYNALDAIMSPLF
jgi:hypothetical protein